MRTRPRELLLVHGVVLSHHPLPVLVLSSDGEEFLVCSRLACTVTALAAVMKNGQRRSALPLRQLPGKQRMLRLGIADKVSILLAVIVLPNGEQFVAVSIAQLAEKNVDAVLNGAVAQGIHPNADRQASQRIVVFGPRKHWSLIAQPPDVAEKSKHQQRGHADSYADLYASEPHPERKFIRMATYGKITAGERGRTCTAARTATIRSRPLTLNRTNTSATSRLTGP